MPTGEAEMDDRSRAVSRVRQVDILPFRDPELRTFAGRDRGQAARTWARLDQTDVDPALDHVIIQVPEDTWDVGSGFWLGMFGGSVRRLGPDRFRERYRFRGGISEEDIQAGIEDALLEEEHRVAGSLRFPTCSPICVRSRG